VSIANRATRGGPRRPETQAVRPLQGSRGWGKFPRQALRANPRAGSRRQNEQAGRSEAAETAGSEVKPGMEARNDNLEIATFAAGCFWGVEAAFRKVDGVVSTRVGYTGGQTEHPTYREVCSDRTGHAEAVEVTYDPEKVSYEELLDVFWSIHDPTQCNRQGPDVGSQYRSAVFHHNGLQARAAMESKRALEASGKFKRPIATEIAPAGPFYPAEDYHQQYYEKRGIGSCPTH
jgi:peptide-methionine (S)-S-oxide reductase